MTDNSVNADQLLELAFKGEESGDFPEGYFEQSLWVKAPNADGSYELYVVTGFDLGACQPTLELEHVEHVGVLR